MIQNGRHSCATCCEVGSLRIHKAQGMKMTTEQKECSFMFSQVMKNAVDMKENI